MVKIANLVLPPELEELYHVALKPGDRFTYSRIVAKQSFYSRQRRKGMSQRTLLPLISSYWNDLTIEQQTAWTGAAEYSDMSGFQLFVQDTSKRIINDLAGVSTPSIYHQSNVGKILIESPASNIKLIQIHPNAYYTYNKVGGTQAQYEYRKVNENMALPFQLGVSYKSDLTATGSPATAKIYAEIISSYQSVEQSNICEINFALESEWQTTLSSISALVGHYLRYNLYVELENIRGELLFDNVKAIHGATNYARDPKCNSIDTTFTKQFYQIPKHWAPIELPEGAQYDSVFPEV